MLSIVFPTYNEQDNLKELHKRLDDVSKQLPREKFEFIFVDDCSNDQSPAILKELNKTDKRVKTIRFARNCGGHAAITAGLMHCQGDTAVVMASDLQDPPEIILSLYKKWQEGSKIIWAVRSKREGESFSTKLFSKIYYWLVNHMTNVKMPPLGTDVFLADRAVIDEYKRVVEKHTSIYLTFAWMGFEQAEVEYVKEKRHGGHSSWTLGKKVKLMLDSILSFSYLPVRWMSALGFLTAFLGFLYALVVFWNFFYRGTPVEGWSSLIVVILFIGGIQMMMLGVLGEYLWRTFDESRRRPRYIIEYKID